MEKEINWNASGKETDIIVKIAKRTFKIIEENALDEYPHMDIVMDITAVHMNGNKLDLQRFLDSDNRNFTHDVFGIRNNLDRTTGLLENHFLPRFTYQS